MSHTNYLVNINLPNELPLKTSLKYVLFKYMESPKLNLHYNKINNIDLEYLKTQYIEKYGEPPFQPFDIENLQAYNPIYSLFFEMNSNNFNSITLNQKYQIKDLETVINTESKEDIKIPVFIKYAPLLDPIKYLIGKYENMTPVLPILDSQTSTDVSNICIAKLNCPNNASYIDNFFYYLNSQLLHIHKFSNGLDYYGSFLGIQKHFKFNVADDIDYLLQSDYFNENNNNIYVFDDTDSPYINTGSRCNKQRLEIEEDVEIDLDDFETIETDRFETPSSELVDTTELCYEKSNNSSRSLNSSNNSKCSDTESDSDEESSSNSDDSNTESEGDEDLDEDSEEEGSSEEDSDEDSEEEVMNAYIKDFPTQMIFLESCQGTIDDLFSNKIINHDEIIAALFQVIMSLLTYQKAFQFTHNDLHTNNIMYMTTTQKYLYYKYDKTVYRVPTYGKIYKIIDFGRAIYKYQGRILCSDSFDKTGDASSQYNCEPYFNSSKPRLEPNMSFDICRLGCSMFDFVFDDVPVPPTEELSEVQKLILEWVCDDNGKNILYKANGDERYPNFKLYKMIARTVHKHTPKNQLSKFIFKDFVLKNEEDILNMELDTHIIDIDDIPSYI
tara:strand:- start:10343 stop:12181 length:1839 start_codon:yes stop_codon:yes gene_type:complete